MVKAFVCGCAGLTLSDEEIAFIEVEQPWGLILFRRNVDAPEQLRSLTTVFRNAVGRADAPVLIDQEGGRVQRLRPPAWPSYPAAAAYGALAQRDPEAAREAARLGGRLIADDLRDAGITVDCAPVLDLPVPGSSEVVGDRAFGRDAQSIAALARAFAAGLLAGGVLPVMKHLPGHGRALVDSHHDLPVVKTGRAELAESDFEPFRMLSDLPAGMSAHVVYTALDPQRAATVSPTVVADVIRGAIGFDGLLLSDDLSMNALKGSLGERAAAALAAGCDLALHCNGKLEEAREVAAAAPPLADRAAARAAAAQGHVKQPVPFDRRAALDRLASLMAAVPATA